MGKSAADRAGRYMPFGFEHPQRRNLEYLLSSQWDIQRAKRMLRYMTGEQPMFAESGVIAMALYTQALVSYVRAFTTGRRKGLTAALFDGYPEMFAAHQEFTGIRDRHVAHPVDNLEQCTVLVAAKSKTAKPIVNRPGIPGDSNS